MKKLNDVLFNCNGYNFKFETFRHDLLRNENVISVYKKKSPQKPVIIKNPTQKDLLCLN